MLQYFQYLYILKGKKKRRVNILGDLILFFEYFFSSILIYKGKNTNLINKFLKFSLDFDQ